MRFFEPTDEFLDWLAAYAGRRITIDVGCGEAHIVRALNDRGVRVLGIEPAWLWAGHYDPMMAAQVVPTKAESSLLIRQAKDSLVLFCRPCHDLFVERTIAVLPPGNEVLYISLPHNLGLDFDLGRHDVEVLDTPACPGGEMVWRVSRRGHEEVSVRRRTTVADRGQDGGRLAGRAAGGKAAV